jgi:hypothetical protein
MKLAQDIPKLTLSFLLICTAIISSAIRGNSQSLAILEEAAREAAINFVPIEAQNSDEPPEDNTVGTDHDGTRGDCVATAIPLTRLMGHRSPSLYLTTNPHPTFWFYVPYQPDQVTSGVFSLQDPAGSTEYWRTRFHFPETASKSVPGIVSVTLPQTEDPLEPDFIYQWFFEFDCPKPDSSNERTSPASINGQVQRVEVTPELEEKLHAANNSVEQAEIYAQEGFWYDVLTEVGQLYLDNPESEAIGELWQNLLQDIGLDRVSTEPMIGPVEALNPQDTSE